MEQKIWEKQDAPLSCAGAPVLSLSLGRGQRKEVAKEGGGSCGFMGNLSD